MRGFAPFFFYCVLQECHHTVTRITDVLTVE